MKNQRMKTRLTTHFSKLFTLAVMLLALVCCFGVLVSAANGEAQTFTVEEVKITGLQKDAGGFWVKDYDGTTAAGTGATVVIKDAEGNPSSVPATSVAYTSANVGADAIVVKYKVGETEYSVQVPAKINPKQLSWKQNGVASVTYQLLSSQYAAVPVTGYALNLPAGVTLVAKVDPISFESVGVGDFVVYAAVTLVDGNGTAVTNYTVPALPVTVTVNPVKITSVQWSETGYRYTFGDDQLYAIEAVGVGEDGNSYPLNVMIKDADGKFLTLSDAYAKGLYGQVKNGEETTRYTVHAIVPETGLCVFAENITDVTREVAVDKKYFDVTLPGMTVLGEADLSDPTNIKPILYQLAVKGEIPAEILAGFTYTYYDASGNKVSTDGVSAPGTYKVVASVPAVDPNSAFDNYGFNYEGELSATLVVKKHYIAVGTAENPYQMIIIGKDGLTDAIKVNFSIPEALNAKTLYGFHVHDEYTLAILGAQAGETFQVIIPVSSNIISNPNCDPITLADLYVYDMATGEMVPASEKYSVSLSSDGAYYIIDSFASEGEVTFIIAPVYHAPFFATAPGVALIVLLVLIVLLILFFVGLKLRQIERSGKNKTLVIETEGETPKFDPIVVPDKIDDPDACLAESIDDLADALRENVEAPVEELDENVDASDAVKEALNQLAEEASAIILEDENAEADAAAEEATRAMADALAKDLQETVDAESNEKEADADAVSAAVAEAMAENFNESADSTDAIALIVDEDELTPEAFREVIDSIVAEAMTNTMVLPENAFAAEEETEIVEETVEEAVEETEAVVEEAIEEATEQVTEEATEQVTEEATEEVTEEAAEEVTEEATEEVTEEATEEVTEEATEEVTEEATEEVTEEATEEVTEEVAEEAVETMAEVEAEEAVEEVAAEEVTEETEEAVSVCAVVADSVAEAFDLVTVDGVAPKAVEGTTMDSITDAVNNAADAYVPTTWTEEMADEVKVAVVEELAARLLGNNEPEEEPVDEEPEIVEEEVVEEPVEEVAEEEVVEEPVEEVAEEETVEEPVAEEVVNEDNDDDDNDNDNDDDDEDSSFGGFGSMPLTFIDAIAEAEKYSEMLEQEARGEVKIVTRYRRSFQSRMIQSQGSVQDYYNEIKNLLLSYKGIKSRISWNYEAFNLGRTHVAKFNAKTRTLYIYMALNPEELADTKYNVVDVSSKKKYATVPVLIKIKGERKFKHAMELIVKLCEEKLGLAKKKVVEEIDYRLPFKTTEELVNEGVIKKMVAAIPMELLNAEQNAEQTAEQTAEQVETPVEEAPVEAPAEEVPASAEVVEDEKSE